MKNNEQIDTVQDGVNLVKEAATKRHRSLEERLVEFYGKPIDEIDNITGNSEVDWGPPIGAEL